MEHNITIPRALLEQALDALDMSRRFVYQDNRPQADAAFDALRAELAKPTAPAWHDAPTVEGLWLNSINRRAMLLWKNELAAWSDTGARWYGPIPQEGGAA